MPYLFSNASSTNSSSSSSFSIARSLALYISKLISFKKQKMKCTEGYHKQKLPSENFFEVIQYIKYHDAGTVKRMSKKSRLEKLLEMVEMELKMKNTEEKDYGYDNMPELRRTNIR